VKAVPGTTYTITKYIGIDHTWADSEDRAAMWLWPLPNRVAGTDDENEAFWKHKWNFSMSRSKAMTNYNWRFATAFTI
jgi:hypothetical protein